MDIEGFADLLVLLLPGPPLLTRAVGHVLRPKPHGSHGVTGRPDVDSDVDRVKGNVLICMCEYVSIYVDPNRLVRLVDGNGVSPALTDMLDPACCFAPL